MAKAVPTSQYKKFVDLQNELARANNFTNMAKKWVDVYDDGSEEFSLATFRHGIRDIWERIRPHYQKLHAYVRMKLRKYPRYSGKIEKNGCIPANLLGNMWAQEWGSLAESTKPFPNAPTFDVTDAMKKANYTPQIMLEKANEFFKGLGLFGMTPTFFEKSMIMRPEGREVDCQLAAWDFCLGKGSSEFRMTICAKVNQNDFLKFHVKMSQIEYFMEYADQPFIFRDDANPAFDEGIGDAILLSVATPKHLQCKLGLEMGALEECSNSSASPADINYLYNHALKLLPLFPFAFSVESWRLGVFEGKIPEEEYNKRWWEIRAENQGIIPPSPRNYTQGLDAAAKYHIVANEEYLRFFFTSILQFQFYEAMCVEAGEFNRTNPLGRPLYHCDFSGSKEAGKFLGDMMKLGFSEPWPVALKRLTGFEKISIGPFWRYFKPFFDHLDQELKANGETPGFSLEEVK